MWGEQCDIRIHLFACFSENCFISVWCPQSNADQSSIEPFLMMAKMLYLFSGFNALSFPAMQILNFCLTTYLKSSMWGFLSVNILRISRVFFLTHCDEVAIQRPNEFCPLTLARSGICQILKEQFLPFERAVYVFLHLFTACFFKMFWSQYNDLC